LTACDDFFDMLVIAPKYNVRSLVLLILVIVALLARERSALATLIASRRVCGFVIMSFCLSVCLSGRIFKMFLFRQLLLNELIF